MMKKLILPEKSTILTEDEIKKIEAGADSSYGFSEMINDIFTITMNLIVNFIGNIIFDPIDIFNRTLRNMFSPYASSSVLISEENQRTSLM